MDRVEEWVLENKNKIEKGVEIIGQGCEVLAATVGQLHPILEAVFVASAELLKNPEGEEAKYLAEQFEKINQKLEGIQGEVNRIALEMQLSSMNKQNFDYEVQMHSQYRKFLEFVNAELDSKKTKKGKFIRHYENTGRDRNLDALYNAFTGDASRVPMLDTVLAVKQRSRRAVEEFCAQLKKLFVVGIIAVIGYNSLKEESVEEKTFNETLMKDIVKKWQGRMEDVEKRMKAAVDDCTQNFATQAKEDIGQLLQEKQGSSDPNFTKSLLDFLAKKYDWVSWSLRVISNREWFFWNWFAGNKYHGWCGGANFFDILTKNNIRVVISFSAEPKPINKVQIQEQIEGQKLKGDMESVAQSLCNILPNCVVHAVSRYKDVVESNNFQEECYYFEKNRKAHLYIHSK